MAITEPPADKNLKPQAIKDVGDTSDHLNEYFFPEDQTTVRASTLGEAIEKKGAIVKNNETL